MNDAEELSEQLDLEEWFDRESLSYKLTRGVNGMQINAKECPNCGDTRSRVYLNAETGIGNCFVCNAPFNKLKFINLTRNEPWRDTFRHVREVLTEQGWRPRRKTTVAVEFGEVKLPVSFPLPTGEGKNLRYLADRGIDGDLARYFHLRFCVKGWWNFAKEDGSTGGQRFDERVIIPVFDLDGSLVTFQGRDVTGNPETEKYLFPKMLPGTGRYLFNGQNALGVKRLVAGEGAFDVMAIKKALDEDVSLRDVCPVGTFGKHLSYGSADGNDQLGRFIDLKRRGLQEVTLMWDGETNALTAALDACQLLSRHGIQTRVALLPSDKDPNEVEPSVVRQAFVQAKRYTPDLDLYLRLKNPYRKR